MIKLQVIGYLGKDAVINTVNGDNTVINFNVAHSSRYKDRAGNTVEKTTWVSCSYWTQHTNVAQYLKKGQQVFVEGEPETEVYNRSNSAEGIVALQKCRVSRVELLGRKGDSPSGPVTPSVPASPYNAKDKNLPTDAMSITEPIDDLPF